MTSLWRHPGVQYDVKILHEKCWRQQKYRQNFQNLTIFLKNSEKMRSNEWSPILIEKTAENLCQFEYRQK